MHTNLGESILNYASNTKKTLVLVAPFIKKSVLSRIIEKTSVEVGLTIVTRWIPEEIIRGVSDVEIWELIKEHNQIKLFLCQNLHAKYYRFDDFCLVGSANLTNRALGFKEKSNLELILTSPFDGSSLQDFETALFSNSFFVTQEIYDDYSKLVEKLNQEDISNIFHENPAFLVDFHWIPSLRNPEELYLAYSDQWERLTTVGKTLAKQELCSWEIAQGLSEENFKLYISLALKQTAIVQTLDQYLECPRRFGEMKKVVADFLAKENLDLDPSHTWQTLMRWLLFFVPDRYSYKVFDYSEVFYRYHQ